MIVRRASEDDLDAILALVRRVVPLMRASGNLQWSESYPNRAVFERDLSLEQLWVAEEEKKIIGVAALTRALSPEYAQVGWDLSESSMVVHRLAVDLAQRGKGIARTLMQQAEGLAVASGVAVLRVDTNAENHAMQRLILSLGYGFSGEFVFSDRPGQRFFAYEKRLNN